MTQKYETISLDRITDPEEPLRSDLSPESVVDLTESIKKIGVIEPLIVRVSGDNFEIIAGHRRLVAARYAGLSVVPCVVREEEGLEAETLKIHENLARAEINPIDWAKHLSALRQRYNLSFAKLADLLGMSQTWVSQHLQILQYPKEIFDAVEQNKMSFSSARELVQIHDPVKREVYVRAAVRGGVTPQLAAQWRREANREPLKQPMVEQNSAQQPSGPSTGLHLPVCPVCVTEIQPEDQIIITIHRDCQPQPEPTTQ